MKDLTPLVVILVTVSVGLTMGLMTVSYEEALENLADSHLTISDQSYVIEELRKENAKLQFDLATCESMNWE